MLHCEIVEQTQKSLRNSLNHPRLLDSTKNPKISNLLPLNYTYRIYACVCVCVYICVCEFPQCYIGAVQHSVILKPGESVMLTRLQIDISTA